MEGGGQSPVQAGDFPTIPAWKGMADYGRHSKQRKLEIVLIQQSDYEAGYRAYEANVAPADCPSDASEHWCKGWFAACREHARWAGKLEPQTYRIPLQSFGPPKRLTYPPTPRISD